MLEFTSNTNQALPASVAELNLCCPACKSSVNKEEDRYLCTTCKKAYPIEDGIPLMFLPNEWEKTAADITHSMKEFYEKKPFPNYDGFDDVGTLIEKAQRGVFARMLDQEIPFGSSVLECGCGTGQLSNFLSISNRQTVGIDMCFNSLKLANGFKNRMALKRARFFQMNIFRPIFKPESFDVVISNGVLHHTSNPRLAFETIAKIAKPGGHVVIGLYHQYGRLFNDFRRKIFPYTKGALNFLDKRLVDKNADEQRKDTWYADQYLNPHESKHTIAEVVEWFEGAGIDFVSSIPKPRLFDPIRPNDKLFSTTSIGSKTELFIKELSMAITDHQDGGFFVVIGKKRKK